MHSGSRVEGMTRKVEPQASGRYKVRFRLAGKQTSETFDTKRDATEFAKVLDSIGAVAAIKWLYDTEDARRVPSLDTIASQHIDELTGIEDGTRVKYRRIWAAYWSPRFGHMLASQITDSDVKRAINDLDGEYAAKTIRNAHALLSAVLGSAVAAGYLTANPAKRIRLPRSKESERVDMRIITPAEMDDILARLNVHYRPFVRFLVGTGARFSEATALQVQDVTLPNVRIRRAVKWSPDRSTRVVGAPKTRKGNRTITIGQTIAADLTDACANKARTELVWTAPRGGPIMHRTFWSDIWLPAVAHLEPRPRIHDLRHSHASWLLAAGVPIHVVQVRLGHESIKTTVDTYGHLLPDAQVAAASAAELGLGAGRPVLE